MQNTRALVGLFPSFGQGITGGIETSAEIAWEAFKDTAYRNQRRTFLLCYGRKPNNSDAVAPDTVYVSSKLAALLKSLDPTLRPKLIFIWHLGLIKLIPPLLRHRPQVIVYLHGIEAWRRHDLLTRYLLPRVDGFLCNSSYTWNRFLAHYPALHVKTQATVHLGLGSPQIEPVPPPDLKPKLLMLSRLSLKENYKGHKELIAAWPEVLSRIPNAELLIAGTGDSQSLLEKQAHSLGLPDSIRFLGYVTEVEKSKLLENCRAFAMPSRNEGFGLVYLEAMRMGRPCLVSTEDAGREVVNPPETGLAADLDNPSGLVNAICRLLTPGDEWEAWSSAAKRRYEALFTAQMFQDRLIAALQLVNV